MDIPDIDVDIEAAVIAAELVDAATQARCSVLTREFGERLEEQFIALCRECGRLDQDIYDLVDRWTLRTLGRDADLDGEVWEAARRLAGIAQIGDALRCIGVELGDWWPG